MIPVLFQQITIDPKFSKISDKDNVKYSYVFFANIPLGIGEIIGGQTVGNLADRFGQRVSLLYISLILVVLIGVSMSSINS